MLLARWWCFLGIGKQFLKEKEIKSRESGFSTHNFLYLLLLKNSESWTELKFLFPAPIDFFLWWLLWNDFTHTNHVEILSHVGKNILYMTECPKRDSRISHCTINVFNIEWYPFLKKDLQAFFPIDKFMPNGYSA